MAFGRIPRLLLPLHQEKPPRETRRRCGSLAQGGIQVQSLEMDTAPTTKAMFLKIVLASGTFVFLCVMYRPPRQGPAPLDFLTENMDDLLTCHCCRHVLIVRDQNHHL